MAEDDIANNIKKFNELGNKLLPECNKFIKEFLQMDLIRNLN